MAPATDQRQPSNTRGAPYGSHIGRFVPLVTRYACAKAFWAHSTVWRAPSSSEVGASEG